jgi:hypothetical protein
LHHAGAAPARAVWKTAMRAATSMMRDYCPLQKWLNSELRRTLLGFSEALICLSYSAVKLVPPRGNAPRSIDYRSIALLLSYEGYISNMPVHLTISYDEKLTPEERNLLVPQEKSVKDKLQEDGRFDGTFKWVPMLDEQDRTVLVLR